MRASTATAIASALVCPAAGMAPRRARRKVAGRAFQIGDDAARFGFARALPRAARAPSPSWRQAALLSTCRENRMASSHAFPSSWQREKYSGRRGFLVIGAPVVDGLAAYRLQIVFDHAKLSPPTRTPSWCVVHDVARDLAIERPRGRSALSGLTSARVTAPL